MNLCVLVVASLQMHRDLYLHFGEELPTERKFGNFIDHYAIDNRGRYSRLSMITL